MRIRVERNGFSVHAIAGTEVVLFGMDLPRELAGRLLGFGFERITDATGERRPLEGFKTFEATESPGHRRGDGASTMLHPVQAFLWGDYVVEPDTDYTYRVVALGGTPENLVPLAEVMVPVQTEAPHRGKHGVWFNRATTASQAYTNRFQGQHPKDVPNREAFAWLSRGLEEALLKFVDRAGPEDALRAAVYEFEHDRVLDRFRMAAERGVDVRIVMDAKENGKVDHETGARESGAPREDNIRAVAAAGISHLVKRREASPGDIAHNKFIVHLRGGQPVAVWTGSTNITQGGIFGHSNVGHLVRDPAVAAHYLAYWRELDGDPDRDTLRAWNDRTVMPTGLPPKGVTVLFSPRTPDRDGPIRNTLAWYADLATAAEGPLFLTAAFGITERMERAFAEDRGHLRYGMLNTRRNDLELMSRGKDNVLVVGSTFDEEMGGWAKENLHDLNGRFTGYLHTKILLIDPLSEDPIVITGSANFSDASSDGNDENMLVIRGNTRVADIYLTEFMRVFKHLESRAFTEGQRSSGRQMTLTGGQLSAAAEGEARMSSGEPTSRRSRHLAPVPGWATELYFDHPDWQRTRERVLFAGTPPA